ncbi:hypothetical protein LG272_11030 [Pseudidiomarina marina]|uniref:hypothetical protein n=1 Tax=Pseudidiomarina marina TaxID=502366 RepID=UPI00384E3123
MKIRINELLVLLLFAKILVLIAVWIGMGDSTQIGDTQDYISGKYIYRNDLLSTAYIMSVTGYFFNSITGSALVSNIPLLIVSYIAVVYFLKKASMPFKYNAIILTLLCLSPNYLLWTSLHSKEAVFNTAAFFYLGLLVSTQNSTDIRNSLKIIKSVLLLACLLIMCFFKVAYTPILLFIHFMILYKKYFKNNMILILIMLSFFLFLILIALKMYISELDSIFSVMHLHFSGDGDNTRLDHKWNGLADMLSDLPIGVVVSFWGPTISELSDKFYSPIFFIESFLWLCALIYFLSTSFNRFPKISLWLIILFAISIVGFIVVHYPFGYFNSGSALRYRQNFAPFLISLVAYFGYQSKKK